MKYMGSKARHKREILPILLRHRREDQLYIEPFVGGANMIDDMSGLRVGCDIDEDLIELWSAVSQGWVPPSQFDEVQYRAIRSEHKSPLRGYAAFALSYGGKKFGGWCRDSKGVRDYVNEARRSALIQFPKLRDVLFIRSSYDQLHIPNGSLVYCDPPYQGSTEYSVTFDHARFWEWVRQVSKYSMVFVSEYSAPADFSCVWSKTVTSSLTADTGGRSAVERLFTLRTPDE